MKKQIIKLAVASLLTVLMYPVVHGQTQRGQSVTLGTVDLSLNEQRIGLSNQTAARSTIYMSDFSVNRGAFFKDNWLIGYSLGLFYNRRSVNGTLSAGQPLSEYNVSATVGMSSSLFLRRYWSVVDRLSVYAGGGVGGSLQLFTYKLVNTPQPTTGNGLSWQVAPIGQVGALYALTNRIGLEATISTNGFPTGASSARFGIAILGGRTRQPNTVPDGLKALQTQQGRWLLGASANMEGASQSDDFTPTSKRELSNSKATVGLLIGRFVKDNVLAGLTVDYTASRSGGGNAPGAPIYSLTVNPFVRSYMGTYRLRPFVEGRAGYGFIDYPQSDTGRRQVNASVSAGLAYMAGDRFIIQTTLGMLGGSYSWFKDSASPGLTDATLDITATGTTLSGISVAYTL